MFRNLAKRYTDSVWNKKDMSIIDEMIDQHVVIHSHLGEMHGPQDMKAFVEGWLKVLPDVTLKQTSIIETGDRVAIQWESNATHQGYFENKKPTGRPIRCSGVTVYRFKEGKIVEFWVYFDVQDVLNQMS